MVNAAAPASGFRRPVVRAAGREGEPNSVAMRVTRTRLHGFILACSSCGDVFLEEVPTVALACFHAVISTSTLFFETLHSIFY